MANGQPRPAFYAAVLLVVIGLVGLAAFVIWMVAISVVLLREPASTSTP